MGDYSIAKSYKGILRIGPILDLVRDKDDELFNSTYYGRPRALVDLSKGLVNADEKGFRNPHDGLSGQISRYVNIDEEGNIRDELRHLRVPMTDSMGNFLNWHIGLDGITIGSNYDINGTSVEIEHFLDSKRKEDQELSNVSPENYKTILQDKYFPVMEAEEIVIGLQNKEYSSDKYKVNKDSQLKIENYQTSAKFVVENSFDKSVIDEENSLTQNNKKLINYKLPTNGEKFRTIYNDNKSTVEEFDVFMYQQDDYDVDNYEYQTKIEINGNSLDILKKEFGNENYVIEKNKIIDANVGIVNLKEYVTKMVEQYTNSNLAEVPTGAIINQFCSLDKWYATQDGGTGEYSEGNFAGHRPPMMSKSNYTNPFAASTYLGVSKNINRLHYKNDKNLTKSVPEIIPLYKRDYVLCDGSVYGVFPYPSDLQLDPLFNPRTTMDRFLDLFFTIGYHYTSSTNVITKRFTYSWDNETENYKLYGKKINLNNEIAEITDNNIRKRNNTDYIEPYFNTRVSDVIENYEGDFDLHSVFVEDFLTILAFEWLYEKYKTDRTNWTYVGLCDELKTVNINEYFGNKYSLSTFVGDSNAKVKEFTNRTTTDAEIKVMDIPYYNFSKDGKDTSNLPMIHLGREVVTFGSPIKFYELGYDTKDESGSIERNASNDKWVIIPAYKLPQIQYLIRMFVSIPEPHDFVKVLENYYRYNFQVPNLTNSVPTFIGSSGIDWADSRFRKIKEVETWSSNYSWDDYVHRHLIFVESQREPKTDETGENNKLANVTTEYNDLTWAKEPNARYKAKMSISSNTYVAGAAWWQGSQNLRYKPSQTVTNKEGQGEHANYIMNELNNQGGRWTSKYNTLAFTPTTVNGMNHYVFQITFAPNTDNWNEENNDFYLYPTGKSRPKGHTKTIHGKNQKTPNGRIGNFNQKLFDSKKTITVQTTDSSEEKEIDFEYNYMEGKGGELYLDSELHNIDSSTLDDAEAFKDDKTEYEKNHVNSFEHYEDPRFDTAEPNRGRTSIPINSKELETCASFRYAKNQENFNYIVGAGEWFAPENIKMLPLIKL